MIVLCAVELVEGVTWMLSADCPAFETEGWRVMENVPFTVMPTVEFPVPTSTDAQGLVVAVMTNGPKV